MPCFTMVPPRGDHPMHGHFWVPMDDETCMRLAHAAIGYPESFIDSQAETYAYVARTALEALGAYAEDVRAGRHLKGQAPKKAA